MSSSSSGSPGSGSSPGSGYRFNGGADIPASIPTDIAALNPLDSDSFNQLLNLAEHFLAGRHEQGQEQLNGFAQLHGSSLSSPSTLLSSPLLPSTLLCSPLVSSALLFSFPFACQSDYQPVPVSISWVELRMCFLFLFLSLLCQCEREGVEREFILFGLFIFF